MRAHRAFAAVHRQAGGLELLAHHRRHAFFQALHRITEYGFAVVRQRKSSLRIGQRQAFQHGGAMGVFGVFGFQEFAPRGRVEKKFAHFHRGAFGVRRRIDRAQNAIFGTDFVCVRQIGGAAGQRQARYGGDAGQPFAAKAHAADVFQIVQLFDFAGGVARECQGKVVGVDAAAVVGHADELDAAARQFHADMRRPRVQAVFHDFFECGGGAFHHFAGGDLIDEMVGQGMNTVHG